MKDVYDIRYNHFLEMAEKNREAGLEDMAMYWKGRAEEVKGLYELFKNDFIKSLLKELEDYGKLGHRSKVIINDDNYIPVSVISKIVIQNANGEHYNWDFDKNKKKEG